MREEHHVVAEQRLKYSNYKTGKLESSKDERGTEVSSVRG